jgi:glutaredoxin-like protein NrdH
MNLFGQIKAHADVVPEVETRNADATPGKEKRTEPGHQDGSRSMSHTVIFTVLTRKPCVQCDATIRHLTRRGLIEGEDFVLVDAESDPEAFERARALSYTQAPVVYAGQDHWSGFRPDKLDEHIKALAAA